MMTQNLDNALHGVQDARTAIMIEGGEAETLGQRDDLKAIDDLLKEAEALIRAYGN